MDIGALSMVMNTGKENASQMTDIIENFAVDTSVGQNLDVRA